MVRSRIRRHRNEEQAAALEPDLFLSWTPFLASLQDYDEFRALGITSINPVEGMAIAAVLAGTATATPVAARGEITL